MIKILFLYVATLAAFTTFAQNYNDSLLPKWQMEGVKAMNFKSVTNNHEYVLLIKLPPSYNDSIKQDYPVLFTVDGQWNFPTLMETENALLYDNLMQEIISVGIAFKENYFANRNRDLTPTHTDFDSASGGAPKFLEAITKEIIPYIDSHFRTDKKNRGLLGGSSGGLFVLYTLLQQPSPFNRFIANSPSLSYDNQLMLKMEKNYSEKNHELNAKVFISNGGYEDENDYPPNIRNFIEQLTASKLKGLEIESLVDEKTGHLSNGFYANVRGLQFIFSKPDVEVDSLLLKQYAGRYEQGLAFLRKENSLYIDMGVKKLRLCAANKESFYLKGANGIGKFSKDDKGKVTGVYFVTADGTFFSKKLD